MIFKQTFEIVKTTMGATSIRDNRAGEILHNPVGPWNESRSLYVEQSQFESRLRLDHPTPLVLYDVGLGAGFNVMAALEVFYKLKAQGVVFRDLHIMSFETDLTLFDFSLNEIANFPENLPYKKQLEELRRNEIYTEDKLHWELHGSFSKTKNLSPAEVIFYDPYSPKINPEMWTVPSFDIIQKNVSRDLPACLVTYSTATRIRVAMLLAGLYVGHGKSSGQKEETTFAGSTFGELQNPLGARWLERVQRSHIALPLGEHDLTIDVILERLRAHPQFSNETLAK